MLYLITIKDSKYPTIGSYAGCIKAYSMTIEKYSISFQNNDKEIARLSKCMIQKIEIPDPAENELAYKVIWESN